MNRRGFFAKCAGCVMAGPVLLTPRQPRADDVVTANGGDCLYVSEYTYDEFGRVIQRVDRPVKFCELQQLTAMQNQLWWRTPPMVTCYRYE